MTKPLQWYHLCTSVPSHKRLKGYCYDLKIYLALSYWTNGGTSSMVCYTSDLQNQTVCFLFCPRPHAQSNFVSTIFAESLKCASLSAFCFPLVLTWGHEKLNWHASLNESNNNNNKNQCKVCCLT